MSKCFFFAAALFLPFVSTAQYVVDFENFQFPSGQNYWNGSDESGNFTINGATFNNYFNPDWFSWSGFSVSSEVDVTTAGWMNQYSVFAGTGANNSQKFGVWYTSGEVTFDVPTQPVSMAVTNTTYAAISMRDGDAYAKKFGSIYNADGEIDGTDGKDWFRLTISGMSFNNEITGSIDFYLADFRSDDSLEHYILDAWSTIDLTSLGSIERLIFEIHSSDVGTAWINTPTYFAMDNLIFYQSSASLVKGQTNAYQVYPNPAQDVVHVRELGNEEFAVKLLNVNGSVILETESRNQHTLHLNDFPNCVYLLQLTSNQGVRTERIVISR